MLQLVPPPPDPPNVTDQYVEIYDPIRARDVEVHLYAPSEPGAYPLIVFSHGGNGQNDNLPIVELWASLGFVVAAPEHVDESDSEGLIDNPGNWHARVADIRLVLDNQALLENAAGGGRKIDRDFTIAAGHSMGAFMTSVMTGVETPLFSGMRDERFDAALMLSPQGEGSRGFNASSWNQYEVPALFLTGTLDVVEPFQDGGLGRERIEGFFNSPPGGKHAAVIEGATHLSFIGNAGAYLQPQFEQVQAITRLFLEGYGNNDQSALDELTDVDAYQAAHPVLISEIHEKAGLEFIGTPADDSFVGTSGADRFETFGGADTIDAGGGNDDVAVGDGDDVIEGGEGVDVINAGPGADLISGGDDGDTLRGDDGDDEIAGGKGDDTIEGGLGRDRLSGGQGDDVFVYSAPDDSLKYGYGHDVITDFNQDGADLLDLQALGLSEFVGESEFSAPMQVRKNSESSGLMIEINLDHDNGPEMRIFLENALSIDFTASNLRL